MSGRAHVDGRGGDAKMGWGNPKRTEGVWGQGGGGVRGGGRIAHVYDGALKCVSYFCRRRLCPATCGHLG